ncbi:hypothetical protein MRBLWS13_003008 [Microbacterium sp. LWS13-1.2]|uniref:Uncharacterized protein n=1 Tax=Microbacterium sp. LWS13-1.2 TaxID=3135264 RepID=A0AAU6SEE6_9MICO
MHTQGEVRPRILASLRACARSSARSLPESELFAMNALETALLWLDTGIDRSSGR